MGFEGARLQTMQSVGATWLMVSLNAGPLYIALIQAASPLPFFIFALPRLATSLTAEN